MEQLKKYQFYVILGSIVLLYIGVYFILVSPTYTRKGTGNNDRAKTLDYAIRDITKLLKESKDKIGDKSLIEYHKRQGETLKAYKAKVLSFFKEKDQYLEKPLPGLDSNAKTTELPVFRAFLQKEKMNLVTYYQDKQDKKEGFKFQRGSSFSADQETTEGAATLEDVVRFTDPKEIVISANIKKAQKEFWIIKGFLETFEKGKVKVLSELSFGKEKKEFDGLFLKRMVNIKGKIENQDVPFLVQSMLNNPNFMLVIEDMVVKRQQDYQPPEITIKVPWDERPDDVRKEEAFKKWKDEQKETAVPVIIEITCGVLDYQDKDEIN